MTEGKLNAKATSDDVFRAEPSKNAVKKDLKVLFKEQSSKPVAVVE